ncbi:hypothetical protein C5E16_11370 [Clavibacter michiganensis]|uniref:Uncharacterized protein n=1 Tax=Clavibacter michiganensis TaxID=28447 RepID=A0A2S5VS83_9MICO|nr:hypothetical protein [Clavibacter michiganensis]PPF66546.1 hypothetical protein C5E16_11370 [Clavibacter michiganensis]
MDDAVGTALLVLQLVGMVAMAVTAVRVLSFGMVSRERPPRRIVMPGLVCGGVGLVAFVLRLFLA